MFRSVVTVCLMAMPLLVLADLIDGEELVDPTRPLLNPGNRSQVESGVADMIRNVIPASFEVSFVRASESSPMAIVNEQRVTLGDRVGGATVVAIDRNGVTLSVNDQERRINLYTSGVKTPVTPPRDQQ